MYINFGQETKKKTLSKYPKKRGVVGSVRQKKRGIMLNFFWKKMLHSTFFGKQTQKRNKKKSTLGNKNT